MSDRKLFDIHQHGKIFKCETVWAVFKEYEETILAIYDTEAAAQIHIDWINSPEFRYLTCTRLVIFEIPILNEMIARDRFTSVPKDSFEPPESEKV